MKKSLILSMILGAVYLVVEIVFNAVVSLITTGSIALKGTTSVWMWPIGSVMGFVLGALDEWPWLRSRVNMFFRCIIGVFLIYTIEFSSGCWLNIAWKLDIWRYTDLLNICGQITLMFTPLWFLLCPFAFWLDNVIRYWFVYRNTDRRWIWAPDDLIDYYKRAFDVRGKAV